MLTENQLNFFREKIHELQSALFFNISNAVLKLPPCIINTLKVDEAGQVWFFVSRPGQYLHEFDREFPANLNFFQKGKDFIVNLTGRAFIVSDPEELNELISIDEETKRKAISQMVLIKFKISTAKFEDKGVKRKPAKQRLRVYLNRFLLREKTYKPYSLQPTY